MDTPETLAGGIATTLSLITVWFARRAFRVPRITAAEVEKLQEIVAAIKEAQAREEEWRRYTDRQIIEIHDSVTALQQRVSRLEGIIEFS